MACPSSSCRRGPATRDQHRPRRRGDDYLVKPFSVLELRARVASNLERAAARSQDAAWRRAVTDGLHDALLVLDLDGTVLEVNDRFTACSAGSPPTRRSRGPTRGTRGRRPRGCRPCGCRRPRHRLGRRHRRARGRPAAPRRTPGDGLGAGEHGAGWAWAAHPAAGHGARRHRRARGTPAPGHRGGAVGRAGVGRRADRRGRRGRGRAVGALRWRCHRARRRGPQRAAVHRVGPGDRRRPRPAGGRPARRRGRRACRAGGRGRCRRRHPALGRWRRPTVPRLGLVPRAAAGDGRRADRRRPARPGPRAWRATAWSRRRASPSASSTCAARWRATRRSGRPSASSSSGTAGLPPSPSSASSAPRRTTTPSSARWPCGSSRAERPRRPRVMTPAGGPPGCPCAPGT